MKKILSFALAAALICGILPLPISEVMAEENWTIVDNADSENKYSGNWVLNDESAAYQALTRLQMIRQRMQNLPLQVLHSAGMDRKTAISGTARFM